MATKSIAQSLFPPSTVIQVYTPSEVDVEKQSSRAPMDQTPVTGVSAGVSAVAASVTIDPAGTNNSIDWTAASTGTAGNSITIAYVNNGASKTLSVNVVGSVITINLATDGSSVATTTATLARAAVAAHPSAAALVSGANHAGNDGSGVLVATAATPLAGGVDAVATTQALIAADGTLTVTGVTTGQSYYATGLVGSDYRYLRFQA